MKRILPLVFLFSFSVSVFGQGTRLDKSNFDYIEVTYENGWTGGSTVHIDSLGIVQRCDYRIIERINSANCFVDTLDSYVLDSLNSKINEIKWEQIDSLFDGRCWDCGAYYIKINYEEEMLESTIIGHDRFDNKASDLAKFVINLKIGSPLGL